ncbi:hypothetical protein F4861DRAFT_341786 [Xylaria intraflava]|nr:hypothetical protein F4861DRAFT_341786 [Xylaria intraflava]
MAWQGAGKAGARPCQAVNVPIDEGLGGLGWAQVGWLGMEGLRPVLQQPPNPSYPSISQSSTNVRYRPLRDLISPISDIALPSFCDSSPRYSHMTDVAERRAGKPGDSALRVLAPSGSRWGALSPSYVFRTPYFVSLSHHHSPVRPDNRRSPFADAIQQTTTATSTTAQQGWYLASFSLQRVFSTLSIGQPAFDNTSSLHEPDRPDTLLLFFQHGKCPLLGRHCVRRCAASNIPAKNTLPDPHGRAR